MTTYTTSAPRHHGEQVQPLFINILSRQQAHFSSSTSPQPRSKCDDTCSIFSAALLYFSLILLEPSSAQHSCDTKATLCSCIFPLMWDNPIVFPIDTDTHDWHGLFPWSWREFSLFWCFQQMPAAFLYKENVLVRITTSVLFCRRLHFFHRKSSYELVVVVEQ